MLPNPTNVNSQMQQLANNAVIAAKDKFSINLDFTENSLQQLDVLLQQAHESYKKTTSSANSQNISIENTVGVWGSYFGEVIRRTLGGDWIADKKYIFLQIGSGKVDPLGQVRLRIINGPQYNLQGFFQGIMVGVQNILTAQSIIEPSNTEIHVQKGASHVNRNLKWKGFIIASSSIFGLGVIVVFVFWMMQKQGYLNVPILQGLLPNSSLITLATPSPLLKPLTEISSSDLQNALLLPEDFSFDGLYNASDWSISSPNLEGFTQYPNALTFVSQKYDNPQGNGSWFIEMINIFPDERQAQRCFESKKQERLDKIPVSSSPRTINEYSSGTSQIWTIREGITSLFEIGTILIQTNEAVIHILFFRSYESGGGILVGGDISELISKALMRLSTAQR